MKTQLFLSTCFASLSLIFSAIGHADERQDNLKKCLDGKYPSLCNHRLLSASELKKAREAESRAATSAKKFPTNGAIKRSKRGKCYEAYIVKPSPFMGNRSMPRGDVLINSTESFSPMIERVKWGVFHYMSRKHLSRYLTEIEFRWNHCNSEEKIIKNGNKKKYRKPFPFLDLLNDLLHLSSGKQIRRTKNNGIVCLENINIAN